MTELEKKAFEIILCKHGTSQGAVHQYCQACENFEYAYEKPVTALRVSDLIEWLEEKEKEGENERWAFEHSTPPMPPMHLSIIKKAGGSMLTKELVEELRLLEKNKSEVNQK